MEFTKTTQACLAVQLAIALSIQGEGDPLPLGPPFAGEICEYGVISATTGTSESHLVIGMWAGN